MDDDSGDDDTGDDGSDFDAAHPRWPAGSPGGIGGEFAPKDASDATAALHDAISQDAAGNAPSSDGTRTIEGPETQASYETTLAAPEQAATTQPAQGTQVAGVNEDMAVEIMNENQAKTTESVQESAESAAAIQMENDAAAAKEIETGSEPPESVSGLIESIGNAIAAQPYINPDGTLLNAQNAVVDPNKIVGYSLNPNNDKGADKAIVFSSTLGYNQSNADSLIQQLQQGIQTSPALSKATDQYGARFSVDIPVTGPNGNTATVRTGWIYDPGSTTPRLITALVKK